MNYQTIVRTGFILSFIVLSACSAQQTSTVVESKKVASYDTRYSGPKTTIVVGEIENRSGYMQGLFSNRSTQIGTQSKTILKTHLQQTNRFKLVDRDSMKQIAEEAKIRGVKQALKGARYTITGSITEFGRKNVGDKQFFGILGSGKKQIAYSKVSLTIIDVLSSEIVYSVQGAGEFALSTREVLGFSSEAGYDATLTDKVLNLAFTEAVNNIVDGLESGRWKVAE